MATLEDALVTLITNHYGDTALGGTTPANIVNINDNKSLNPLSAEQEWVVVWRERAETRDQINDVYANIENELHIYVTTPTSDDRLKEISDEVIRIINTNAIVGVNDQRVMDTDDRSDRINERYRLDITAAFNRIMAESETTYSATPGLHPTWYTADEVDALLAAFSTDLDGLTDVDLSGPADNDVLVYNDATGKWEDEAQSALTGVDHDAITNTHNLTTDIDHDSITNTHNLTTDIDHDAITNTHNLTTDLDAEIETIITAELVDGQSIDNAVDALITAHTGDVDAHHAATVAGDLNHNDLANIDADDVKHITAAQLAALHTAVVAGDLNHNDLANIDAGDINHLTDAQVAALHATYTDAEAVQAVEDAGLEIATTKALAFVDGGTVDIIRDEDDMASDDVNALCTQQSIKKYVDDNAGGGAGVEDDAFGSGWDADTVNAPSQNAVYDVIKNTVNYPQTGQWLVGNGATTVEWLGVSIKLPSGDDNCYVSGNILIGPNWITGEAAYLNVMFFALTGAQAFSGKWYAGYYRDGDTNINWNLIQASTAYDFPASTQYEKVIIQVPLGTGILAGDVIQWKFVSDATNGTDLVCVQGWISN